MMICRWPRCAPAVERLATGESVFCRRAIGGVGVGRQSMRLSLYSRSLTMSRARQVFSPLFRTPRLPSDRSRMSLSAFGMSLLLDASQYNQVAGQDAGSGDHSHRHDRTTLEAQRYEEAVHLLGVDCKNPLLVIVFRRST